MTRRSVGIVGRMRSGKDTAAGVLTRHHGYTRMGFADPLKTMAYETSPILREGERLADVVDRLGWERAKDDYPEARRVLQRLGVSARETLGPDVWVKALTDRVRLVHSPVVVPDCRFINEAAELRARGFVILRVHRPGLTVADPHVSESESDAIRADVTVTNDSTPDALADRVHQLVKEYVL
ncbi:hypothetical protein DMH03_05830 [Amycolatopsis sp. WAC 01376]|uniref:deoxynucleotide monophosphate kinase family protein n=1 Tax=Amycolatopsis sp. WAC 01376 TaxID=2203195 RepID=UPI000F79F13D|nr:hypothetical protein [Amycolatopsis sp. WAC 01376]RSM66621.1 hypothetical protein DMH03_05830 [Amycolatopsis sp. WAC 01376]